MLVQDGQLPAYFTQNITGKHARTAVGVSRDGNTLYLVAVEKYTDPSAGVLSVGMTQEELAQFLISIGVWRAVNLDGGGSTTLATRHLGDFDASLVNRPQDPVSDKYQMPWLFIHLHRREHRMV
ncbi:MAG: phosphodiester glycosidase family protein [Candidatus Syntrophopropionicum ammoniitolerans]